MTGQNKQNEGGNGTTGIAGALEAKFGKPQGTPEHAEKNPTPQPPAALTDGYRNPKYREAWKELYTQMGMMPQEAETLSRVADLVRPRPTTLGGQLGFFYQTEDNTKQRFLKYLELTGMQDEDYLFVAKNLLPDKIDLQDRKTRLRLGLTNDLIARPQHPVSRYMTSAIIIPSPHMMAALFTDEMAAFYLRELDEIEKEGQAFERIEIPYSSTLGYFNPEDYENFLGFWGRRPEQEMSNPRKLRQMFEDKVDPAQYFDKLQMIRTYLGKGLPRSHTIQKHEFDDLATRFYSFKWDK